MSNSDRQKYRWFKQSDGVTFKTNPKRAGAIVGTIVYSTMANHYTLTTSDGYAPAASTTLENAKGLFRKYLHTK